MSDGVTTSVQHVFTISVKRVQVVMINKGPLHLFPMLKKVVTSNDLLAVTSDYTTSRGRSIVYTIQRHPSLGKLLVENPQGVFKYVQKFSQSEVNDSRIWYEHSQRFSELHANDSFTFDVKADFTETLARQVRSKQSVCLTWEVIEPHVN